MNQEQILTWALEAGFVFPETQEDSFTCWWEELERFAALVAAHEREKFLNKLDGVSEKVIYDTVKEAILAEREACAKLCEEAENKFGLIGRYAAAAIRARGEK